MVRKARRTERPVHVAFIDDLGYEVAADEMSLPSPPATDKLASTTVEHIADHKGFGSALNFRQHFLRSVGTTSQNLSAHRRVCFSTAPVKGVLVAPELGLDGNTYGVPILRGTPYVSKELSDARWPGPDESRRL
jgi:hypothetical protein